MFALYLIHYTNFLKDSFVIERPKYFLVVFLLTALQCFCCVYANGQTVGNEQTGNDPFKVALTQQQQEWVREHPVLRSTSKNAAAPIEFIRAGEAAGFSVDYLNLVAEKVGLKIEYSTEISWQESLERLEKHEIDISHNIIQTAQRNDFLLYTAPYFKLELAIFGASGAEQVNGQEGLQGKRIALLKGLALSRDFRIKYPGLEVVEVDSAAEALLAISEGSIDLYISPQSIANYIIRNNFITGVEILGKADFLGISNTENSRIAVRNDWPILLGILEKGMAAITPQEFSDLAKKWTMPEETVNRLQLTPEEEKWLSANPVIKAVVDPSVSPMEFIDEQGKISGISGSYLDAISKKLGVRFEWVGNETFSDGMELINSKQADVISAASASSNRAGFLIFTDVYMQLDYLIFGREGEDIFGDMNGLFGRTIAMPKGFDTTERIKRDFPEINVIEAADKIEALQLVSGGVADAHIGSIPTTSHTIASENITNLAVSGITPYKTDIAMGIRAELPLLASAMQKAFASITPGERTQINQQWLGLKTEDRQDYTLVWQVLIGAVLIVGLILIRNLSLRREITRRKLSEERFRQIAETVDGIFFICSPDMKEVRYVSPNFEAWTNIRSRDLYKKPALWLDVVHADDLQLLSDAITKSRQSNEGGLISELPDYRILDGQNKIRWISTQIHPVRDDSGDIVSIVGFITDITTSVNSRKKLDEISSQFQNAFTHASHGMALTSLDGRFLRVNDALCKILGYSNSELLKLNIKDVIHPDDVDIDSEQIDQVEAGVRQSCQLEKRNIRKDGSIVPVQLNISMVSDNNGKPDHFVAQIQDLSELKEREEQLRHAQKMDAVGELTGGIAHDFNNILGIILGNLEILKNTIPQEPTVKQRLEKAVKGVERGSSLIKKLLSFSRSNPLKTHPVIINENISNLVEFIKRTFTASVKVNVSLDENLWPIQVDEGDLEGALLNLALNARDAMQGGGELRIETENIVLDNEYVRQNPGSKAGEHVVISVSDTGTGIAPDLMEKILEPFFTTKPVNKGTGLGLSMVHGFVQRSGGHMKVLSEPGEGATFKIYIPKSAKVMTKKKAGRLIEDELPKGDETILILDDEKHLCDLAETQLKELGYQVYTANNAASALDLLSRNEKIDLLFSDIVMPDNLDGYKMASSALEIKPSLKILLTSGYSQNLEKNISKDDEILANLANNMLQKPYNQNELAFAIRKSLDL